MKKQKSSEEIAKLERGKPHCGRKQKFETLQVDYWRFAWFLVAIRLGSSAIMITLLLVGAFGLVEGNNYSLLAWLLLPFFSPRFMGELFMPLANSLELYTSVRHNPEVNTGARD